MLVNLNCLIACWPEVSCCLLTGSALFCLLTRSASLCFNPKFLVACSLEVPCGLLTRIVMLLATPEMVACYPDAPCCLSTRYVLVACWPAVPYFLLTRNALLLVNPICYCCLLTRSASSYIFSRCYRDACLFLPYRRKPGFAIIARLFSPWGETARKRRGLFWPACRKPRAWRCVCSCIFTLGPANWLTISCLALRLRVGLL